MYKLKTHKGAHKRFKLTAKGKVRYKQSHHRHILTKKSAKRKRHLRHLGVLKPCDTPAVRRMLLGHE